MRVLVLGASGFIGARIAAAASQSGWEVRAGARNPAQAAQRSPDLEWVKADFGKLDPTGWDRLLDGADAVVNCVGVLQDAAGDSSRTANYVGVSDLARACERAGGRRLIHISAIGADTDAETSYARTKAAAENSLRLSGIEWTIVRPSLVVDRNVFGGTALIRGLAGLPLVLPVVGGDQKLRPVPLDDLASLVVDLLRPHSPSRRTIEVAGPETVTVAELLKAYRRWLGFPAVPVASMPRWLASCVFELGDVLGWLGWPSALRRTSVRQLDFGAAGGAPAVAGIRGLSEYLRQTPATVQDRWHARLYFLRPLCILILAVVWGVSGAVALGPGRADASALLQKTALGAWSDGLTTTTGWLDVVLAGLLVIRPFARGAAVAMAVVSLGYVAAGTLLSPTLWIDPLGPLLKALSLTGLALFVAATDSRR